MSKKFKCDICENEAETGNLASPMGWMSITISGQVPKTDNRYGGHQSIKYDICTEDVNKIFPVGIEQKDIKTEFAEMAAEFIRELIGEAMDNAQC